jgi:hypothetical protein
MTNEEILRSSVPEGFILVQDIDGNFKQVTLAEAEERQRLMDAMTPFDIAWRMFEMEKRETEEEFCQLSKRGYNYSGLEQ